MANPEQKALDYYQKKDYAAALECFLRLDTAILERGDIAILVANCYDFASQKQEAIKYYKKALKNRRTRESAAANLAIIHYELKNFLKSYWYASLALLLNKKNASALVIKGNIFYCRKNYKKALRFYRSALEIKRDFYTANFNTAGIYFERKDYAKAYFYARRTVELFPASREAAALKANICLELGKPEEAENTLRYLQKIAPDDYWVLNSLSQACQQQKKYALALDEGWRAVVMSEGQNSQHINFGYLLYEIAIDTDGYEAKRYADMWLKKYPDNHLVRHMANAILNGDKVTRIETPFVKEIFDAFADNFEEVLANLNYDVPRLIGEELDSLFTNLKLRKLKILDAGCGTGLCGKYLKKYACRNGLDGVDLSPKMLEVARSKKIYHHLYERDINDFLEEHTNEYDLICAADVFTYFGELNSLFLNLYNALHPLNRIIFSVSENYLNDRDYFLHSSGRFLHSRKYVEHSLIRQGFEIEKMNRAKLRNEGDATVYGWIIMAQRQ